MTVRSYEAFPTLFRLVLLVVSSFLLFVPSTSARHARSLLASRDTGQAPSLTDNLEPAAADPHNSITCLGTSYNLQLPSSSGFDANEVSMQSLCAKTQYNGGKSYQHVGGWCDWTSYGSTVVFDLSAAAQINPFYATPRIMLGCLNRCFCNYGQPPNPTLQPKATPDAGSWESDQTYEVQADVTDDFDVAWTEQMKPLDAQSEVDIPTISHKGKQGSSLVSVAQVQTLSQLELKAEPFTKARFTYLSMNADNKIECSGPPPLWPLPYPYSRWDFDSLQELCSVSFFGGNG